MAAPAATWTGQTLGRYRIGARLGRGGMGEVYRAVDGQLRREVAIKIILPEHAAEPEARARFLREARVVAGLEHPHVLPLYDLGEHLTADGPLPFLVMPLMRGGSLAERLHAGPPPLARALVWIEALAGALDAAHEAGVLHRDVKPANVLIDAHEQLFLADFGIARLAAATTRLTRTGTVTGTPVYMAPEVAAGAETGAPADRYALAVMAFELLTGAPPFTGENALSVMHQHAVSPVPPASARASHLPTGVDRVLAAGMAKEPAERPASCRLFAARLAAALDPASASPTRTLPAAAPVAPATMAGVAAAAAGAVPAAGTTPTTAASTVPGVSAAAPSAAGAAAPTTVPLTPPPRASRRRWPLALALTAAVLLAAGALQHRQRATPADAASSGASAAGEGIDPLSPDAAAAGLDRGMAGAPATSGGAEDDVAGTGDDTAADDGAPAAPGAGDALSGIDRGATTTSGEPTAGGDVARPVRPPARVAPAGPSSPLLLLLRQGLGLEPTELRRLDALRGGYRRPTRADFELLAKVRPRRPQPHLRELAAVLARYGRGGLAYLAGDAAGAGHALGELLADPRAALVLGPGSPLILLGHGEPRPSSPDFAPLELALAYGDPARRAAGELERAAAAAPDDPRLVLARAFLDRLGGADVAAARRARGVFETAPPPRLRSWAALFVAVAHQRRGELAAAVPWYQNAIDAGGPHAALAALELAGLLHRLERPEQARELLRRVCAEDVLLACRLLRAEGLTGDPSGDARGRRGGTDRRRRSPRGSAKL